MNINWTAIKLKVKEHIWGPVGSTVFHVVLIVILLNVASKPPPPPPPPPPEVIMQVKETKAPPPEPAQKIEEKIQEMMKVKPLDENAALPDTPPTVDDFKPGGDTEGNGGTGGGGPLGGGSLFGGGGAGGEAGGIDFAGAVTGPLILKGIGHGAYSGRLGGGLEGLGKAGIWAKAIERAILRALRWLKAAQAADGSWGQNPKQNGDEAYTGLALLCFLAHGDTTSSPEFGATVEKGINWMIARQNKDGYFSPNNQQYPYRHGIATYAACEAYGMTRIPELRSVMDKAVEIILQGQQKGGGGWNYEYKKDARRDTSVSAWQIQALKAAVIAGCTVPGLELAVKDIKNIQNPETGRFGYANRGDGSWGMTGAGTLSLQMLGYGTAAETQLGLKTLQGYKPNWEQGGDYALYGMYYITQAKFQESEASFKAWNIIFAPMYCKNQNPDGSWSAMKKSNEDGQGAVYTTTLACLTIQVYYRFLPTYKSSAEPAAGGGGAAPPASTNVEDVIVKIL
ncbi:MAG: terpene cyclase/mutase family protein [Kiritimatiellaeota bacterium]|nr:terpene cyclase/mutase family protein [Kiritimatiellota bacterium]